MKVKLPSIKHLTKEIVETHLVKLLEENGFEVTPSTSGKHYRVSKDDFITSFYFYSMKLGHFTYRFSERRIKNMNLIFQKVTNDYNKDTAKKEKETAEETIRQTLNTMLPALGFEHFRLNIGSKVKVSVERKSMVNEVAKHYSYQSPVEINLTDGTYYLAITDINLEALSIIKKNIDKILGAWEIAQL